MSAIKQWLVDPVNTETPCYITNKPEVAQKRANAGDYVVELERSAAHCNRPGFAPYYRQVKPAVSQPKTEDDEL
jgi:hypothetical protein